MHQRPSSHRPLLLHDGILKVQRYHWTVHTASQSTVFEGEDKGDGEGGGGDGEGGGGGGDGEGGGGPVLRFGEGGGGVCQTPFDMTSDTPSDMPYNMPSDMSDAV